MKLDKNLNIVQPIETDTGTVYVHSSPIRRETFKEFFLPLSKTLNAIYAEGLRTITGPRIAGLMLREIGGEGITPLLNEIYRLTNVSALTPDGWQSVGLADAVAQKYLTEDEVEEAEGFIVFFTCVWHVHRKAEISTMLQPLQAVWDVETTLLSATEYRASLPTSTETETLVPLPPSSIPM
jgi:hypothetical protein